MKKHYLQKLVLLGVLAIISCSKNEQEIDTKNIVKKHQSLDEDVQKLLKQIGFNLDDVTQVDGENIVMENDIIIDIKSLKLRNIACSIENTPKKGDTIPSNKQYVVNGTGLVNYLNTTDIKYFIAGSVYNLPDSPDWVSAIRNATLDWNNLATNNNGVVNFVEVTNESSANLIFRSDVDNSLPSCAINIPAVVFARAAAPVSGNVGRYISINNDGPFSNLDGKRLTVKHEIGHTLGFRHSDMYNRLDGGGSEPVNDPNACGSPVYGGNLLYGTPDRDVNSVMIATSSGTTDMVFSNGDVLATQILYPSAVRPDFTQTPVMTVYQGGFRISYQVQCNRPFYIVRVEAITSDGSVKYFDHITSPVNSIIDGSLDFSGSPNPHQLKVSGINYRRDFQTGYNYSARPIFP